MSIKRQDGVWLLQRNRLDGEGEARKDPRSPLPPGSPAQPTTPESVREFVRRDYYTPEGDVWWPSAGVAHCPEHDAKIPAYELIKVMLEECGAVDGDEVQVLMVKTGRRPFGDRRYLTADNFSRPETDEEVLRRIEEGYRDGNEE